MRAELRARGCPRSFVPFGAHIAAVASTHNWMGIPRLALLMGFSKRTAQRARRWFEDRGLLRTEMLEPGDQLPGMKAPVRRPMIVRFVGELQELARKGKRYVPPWRRRKASAAELAAPLEAAELADMSKAFLARYSGNAPPSSQPSPGREPKAEQAPFPHGGATIADVDPNEIDQWDRETEALERGPPLRGPPMRA